MENTEDILSKAFDTTRSKSDAEKRKKERQLIKESLRNSVNLTCLKEVILILKDIAQETHENQPYFNWDKDAQLMEFLASYIEN